MILVTFNLSSANVFCLAQSNILLFVKELKMCLLYCYQITGFDTPKEDSSISPLPTVFFD